MFRLLRPQPVLRALYRRPPALTIRPPIRLRHGVPPRPHQSSRHPPPPPPPPPPKAEYESAPSTSSPGRPLIIGFVAITLPITLLNIFPISALPPVPDPAHLTKHSNTPLTLSFAASHPYAALQLFIFRLRRGNYTPFMRRNFSYAPVDFIDSSKPTPWATWLTYMFSHGGMLHWGFCTMALSSLIPPFVVLWGTARTATFFLSAGFGAAAIENMYENYRRGDAARRGGNALFEKRMIQGQNVGGERVQVEAVVPKEEFRNMFVRHLGSSGSLMGMLAVTAITMPQTRWGMLFIPVYVPVRWLFTGLVAWDAMSAVYGSSDGIGHGAHLCGALAGAVLWSVWLQRVPRRGKIW